MNAESSIGVALATVRWAEPYVARLRDCLGAAEFIHTQDPEEVARVLARAQVAILASDLDDRFADAPRLRWVHCDHAGLEKSARPWVFERGLLVTSSSGRSAPALAEHAILFMLAWAYRFPRLLDAQREHRWGIDGQENLRGLIGRTVGIVGLGSTGREVATRAKAFGMRVLGYRRSAEDVPGVDRLYAAERGDSLDELLRESDFVVLATPLSDATYHLLGARELALLKDGAVLVNMARGAVVDEAALIEELRRGRIYAGLDVFEREPLPPESPLWDLPNVLITPHATPQVPDRTGRSLAVICENARRYRAGEPLLNLLRPEDRFSHRR
ncbi:MAG: D-2-hydroxyacid dehydrogenase [Chloroflexota bacterium]|nr:D-2-hydroxyacid dehydrogenase [Chloroflexota bacterium]